MVVVLVAVGGLATLVSRAHIHSSCVLQDRLPSGATRRVQPLQLQEVVSSAYCRVWYSRLGLESEAKLQTRVICLVMLVVDVAKCGSYGDVRKAFSLCTSNFGS
jgi:hypothetical protein